MDSGLLVTYILMAQHDRGSYYDDSAQSLLVIDEKYRTPLH